MGGRPGHREMPREHEPVARDSDASSGTVEDPEQQRHSHLASQLPRATDIWNDPALLAQYRRNLEMRNSEYKDLQWTNYLLREDIHQLEEDRDRFKFDSLRYKHIINNYLQPYSQHLGTYFDDTNAYTIKAVLNPMFRGALEADHLKDELQNLQKEMLSQVEKIYAQTDDQFAQQFRALSSAIKSLSRMTRLSENVNLVEILSSLPLVEDVLPHHWTGRGRKKSFIEACIWSSLIQMIFCNPFAIFGKSSSRMNRAWQNMFGPEHHYGWPFPTSSCETWRYTTVERLAEIADPDNITKGEVKKVHKQPRALVQEDVQSSTIQARAQVIGYIRAGLEQVSSAADASQIRDIVDKAFDLARQMSLQRSRIQVTYPKTGAVFNKGEMSCMPGPNGEELDHGVVAFVANPGLTKWGDALGKNLNHRYDIVPALVQLEPAVEDGDTGVSFV